MKLDDDFSLFKISISHEWTQMATNYGIPPLKQIRYWSFIRILCCPLRSPLRDSKRLPGGIRRSSKDKTESSWSSLQNAIFQIFFGHSLKAGFVAFPLNISSVAWFLNDIIIKAPYHGYHAMTSLKFYLTMPGPGRLMRQTVEKWTLNRSPIPLRGQGIAGSSSCLFWIEFFYLDTHGNPLYIIWCNSYGVSNESHYI